MRYALAALAAILLAGCASTRPIKPQTIAAPVDFTKAEIVKVTLSNFEFSPSPLKLVAGRPYVLEFANTGSGGHDFTAPDFFAAARVTPEDAELIANGQIDLKKGETATVRLIPAAGTFELTCTHFGHAALGMTSSIEVSDGP